MLGRGGGKKELSGTSPGVWHLHPGGCQGHLLSWEAKCLKTWPPGRWVLSACSAASWTVSFVEQGQADGGAEMLWEPLEECVARWTVPGGWFLEVSLEEVTSRCSGWRRVVLWWGPPGTDWGFPFFLKLFTFYLLT